MFRLHWLRRLIRRNTSPIPEDTAQKWKQRLSLAYMLLAWNAFGFLAYGWYQGRGDWADYYGLKTEEEKMMPNNEYFARTIGRSGTTKLLTMRGFSIVDEKEFDYDAEKAKERAKGNQPEPSLTLAQRVEQRRKLREEAALRQKEEQEALQ